MATNRDLLKEAIADAKSVKEVAIANAKLALEEAFTPHLKSMLSAKLDEMDKEDDEVKESEEEVKEMDAPSFERKNSPAGDSIDTAPRKVGTSTVQEDEEVDEDINLDELLAELEDSKKGNKEEQKKMEGAIRDDRDHIKSLEKDLADDEKKLAKLKADKKEDVSENAILTTEEEDEDIKEDERTDAEEEGFLDGEKDEKEDMEDGLEDEEIDLEDMSEDDLKGFIEDVIKDMVAGGEIEPGDEFVEDEVDVEDEIDIEDVEDVDVDIEIDEEMKKAKKDELDEKMSNPVQRKGDDEKKDGKFKKESKPEMETEKMRKMEEDLESAISSVNELKAELNEVNLLNAKLLYTNKIFKAKNLTESKKVKVLKAFDKAQDVKQAKTIYTTLNEGLLDSTNMVNRVKGSASKASGLEPKATSAKQPIIESNDVFNRMRKLAGLI